MAWFYGYLGYSLWHGKFVSMCNRRRVRVEPSPRPTKPSFCVRHWDWSCGTISGSTCRGCRCGMRSRRPGCRHRAATLTRWRHRLQVLTVVVSRHRPLVRRLVRLLQRQTAVQHLPVAVLVSFLAGLHSLWVFIHWRSIEEWGGCFQRHLFAFWFVCLCV